MAKVGIVMGSDSDMPVMAQAADILEKLGVDCEMTIISAHREPDVNGGMNAGILAAKILATSDPELLQRLKEYSESLKNDVVKKAEKLDQIGYKEYLAQKK